MLDYGFYNADCMDYLKDYPDGYFDLAIADPVYGDVTGGGYVTGKYNGIKMSKGASALQKDYHTSLWSQDKTQKEFFNELFRVSKNQIIWGGNYFAEEIQKDSQCWIVWDKQHCAERTFADCEMAYTSFNRASRIFRYRWDGMIQQDMKHKEYRVHPSQKPVALYVWILNNFAKEGDVILDPMVGSGSSLIACRDTGHKYVGFEIDETYYGLAKNRIDQHEAQANIFDYM